MYSEELGDLVAIAVGSYARSTCTAVDNRSSTRRTVPVDVLHADMLVVCKQDIISISTRILYPS